MELIYKWPQESVRLIKTIEGVGWNAKLEDFEEIVKFLASEIPEDINTSEKTPEKLKGDMLEILDWAMCGNIFRSDPRIGLGNYKVIPIDEDYGTDARAINIIGEDVANQCKWKGNPFDKVTYAELARTYTSAKLLHALEMVKKDSLWLFTNGAGANRYCHHVFGPMLREINRAVIKSYIDDNENFWEAFYKLVYELFS